MYALIGIHIQKLIVKIETIGNHLLQHVYPVTIQNNVYLSVIKKYTTFPYDCFSLHTLFI